MTEWSLLDRQRFAKKVRRSESGCLEWIGSKHSDPKFRYGLDGGQIRQATWACTATHANWNTTGVEAGAFEGRKQGKVIFRVVLTGEISDVERKTLDGNKIVTNFYVQAEGVRVRGSAWAEMAKAVPNEGRVLVEGRLAGREYQTNDNPPQTRRSLDLTVTTIEPLGAPKAAAPVEDIGF